MNNYNKIVKLFYKRIAILFVIYQICRLLFLVYNKGAFTNVTFSVFVGGVIYDLAAIGFINLLFVPLHLLPGNFKYSHAYQKALKLFFYVVNLIFIATNFVDFEYYKFTGRRSSIDLLMAKGMENEIMGLIPSFFREFWYLPIGFVVFALVFWIVLGKVKTFGTDILNVKSVATQLVVLLLSLSLLMLMGRGGFRNKPIRVVDAINYSSLGNAAVVLNTPFSVLKTIGKNETLADPKFFPKDQLDQLFNPVFTTDYNEEPIKKNVVIIILESFGDENLQQGFTPFLDSLITQSYYFKNGFANGKVSIDAVPSTLSSIPSLMNTSLISSNYSLNEVYGLPKIMKNQGYGTSFFHGAFNGSQNFDQYCKVAGFDEYFGKDEYVGPEAFDGKWGVFDEEFLQFYNQKLNTFKQPFFSTIFTISSHTPFIVPEKYKGKFKKGTTKIHETVGYSDFALRKFFDVAKKEAWYNNTLFVFTADHTSPFGKGFYSNNVGKFRIPILFFDPSNPELKGVSEQNFQQIDILPSILDYLKINDKVITYGKSYTSKEDFVVTYIDNIYNYFNGDFYLAFDGTKAIGLYDWKKDPLLKNNLLTKEKSTAAAMEVFIKAYIQSFNERIINNNLTIAK
ncbi:LTA synthase family protein [Flavobacterium antarcticum]|uniref:LTA synthase family protein n=1 Tax=Flavobacterium antarcticum TaxID=271155 RepID=UPI0003B43B40|nr:alkaline phosphatase family protein [Flavobacterium antarcticum]